MYRTLATTCLMCCSLPVLSARAAATVQLAEVSGAQHQGDLVAWDTTGITIQTADQSLTIPTESVLSFQLLRETQIDAKDQTFLTLVDGTRLPHHRFTVQDRQATIGTPVAEAALTLSTTLIERVQLMPQVTDAETSAEELVGDQLVIFKKKSGTFDALEGVLGDVTEEQVAFRWDGETIPVKRSKIAALAYFHAQRKESPAPICWLNTAEGARLPVASLNMATDKLSLVTTSQLGFSVPLASVQFADYSVGKLVYLSDLTPQSQQWTPRINLPQAAETIQQYGLPRRDQSYNGSTISLLWPHPKTGVVGGELKNYAKGLALRSRTICEYRLPKGMARFVTTAGIDPQTVEQGHVTLELFSDKRSVWQGEIAGGVDPREISVPLGKARVLRIVVDYGENLDFGDRLHLAEARLTK